MGFRFGKILLLFFTGNLLMKVINILIGKEKNSCKGDEQA